MGVLIKRQLVASRAKTSKGVNGRKYITIHETANTSKGADAQAHANLQLKGFSASWHWQVDDKQTSVCLRVYASEGDVKQGVLIGLMFGLSASGLYSGTKAVIEKDGDK